MTYDNTHEMKRREKIGAPIDTGGGKWGGGGGRRGGGHAGRFAG
jgi:hypothetical protein